MATRVYGCSDDLIEVEGDVSGEYGCFNQGDFGVLLIFSDATVLNIKYGDEGIWRITVVKKGKLFERIEPCDDPEGDPHSDQVFFKNGLTWGYAAKEWEKVH